MGSLLCVVQVPLHANMYISYLGSNPRWKRDPYKFLTNDVLNSNSVTATLNF